jgi:hypothetical protein
MSAKPKERRHRKSDQIAARRGLLPGQAGRAVSPDVPAGQNALIAALGNRVVDAAGNLSPDLAFVAAMWLTGLAAPSPEADTLVCGLLRTRGAPFARKLADALESPELKAMTGQKFDLSQARDPLRAILSAIREREGGCRHTAAELRDRLVRGWPALFSDLDTARVRRAAAECGLRLAVGKAGRPRRRATENVPNASEHLAWLLNPSTRE